MDGAKAVLTFLAVAPAIAADLIAADLVVSEAMTPDLSGGEYLGASESVLGSVSADDRMCDRIAWHVDPRPIEQILPETDYAKRRIRVTRSDDTVIVLLQPFIRGEMLVGRDAADSRISRRPFTFIAIEHLRQVETYGCD